jgi:hypothetical protein
MTILATKKGMTQQKTLFGFAGAVVEDEIEP